MNTEDSYVNGFNTEEQTYYSQECDSPFWKESNQFDQDNYTGTGASIQKFKSSDQEQLTPKGKKKRSLNPMEAKNIPKNLGGLLKNYYNTQYPELVKNNTAIKNFMATAKKKKNLTREDFKKLFEDKVAGNIAQQYFASFQIIADILHSEKIPNISIHLKYIKKFFIATHFPESLQTLKLPE